jgi:ATP-dependent DNA helicase RecQ
LKNTEGTGIVYAASLKEVESLTTELTSLGFTVSRYHGRLERRKRRENQDRFMGGELNAMVATNASAWASTSRTSDS